MSESSSSEAKAKDQIVDYSFNIFGWAVKNPTNEDFTNDETITTLRAYDPCSWTFELAVKKMVNEGVNPWRPSISLTDEEKSKEDGPGIQEYLVVGWSFSQLDEKIHRFNPLQKKRMAIGSSAEGRTFERNEEYPPLIVVTQVQNKEPEGLHLFVLLRPHNGLCTPFAVAQRDVFYLSQFRDRETAVRFRGPSWNQLVANYAVRKSEKSRSPEAEKHEKARATVKDILGPEKSFLAEISILVSLLEQTGERCHIDELKRVVAQAKKDLDEYQPLRTCQALQRFMNSGYGNDSEPFSTKDDLNLVKKVNHLWPNIEHLTPEVLIFIRKGISESNIVVHDAFLLPVIAETCYRCSRDQFMSQAGASGVVMESLQTVKRVFGLHKPKSCIPKGHENALLRALRDKLKEIRAAALKFDSDKRESFDDAAMVSTLNDFWTQFAAAPNTEAARLSWLRAIRYLTDAFANEDNGLGDKVQDVVEVLEYLNLE